MKKPIIFQVVGYSKAGKTTLLTELISYLKKESFSVAAIKSARKHKIEYSNKDSDMFLLSNSDASSVIFEDATKIILNKQFQLESVLKLTSKISDYDFILIEGFKFSSYKKILVLSNKKEEEVLYDLSNIEYILCPRNRYDIIEINKKVKIDIKNIFHNSRNLIEKIVKNYEC